jgi:hypothetical protein
VPDSLQRPGQDDQRWLEANGQILCLAFAHFESDREWPTIERIQHDLELADSPIDAAQQVRKMPRDLGFDDQQRLVLTVRGLSHVPAAKGLLEDWAAALRHAYQLWRADPQAELTKEDLARLFGGNAQRVDLVANLLFREGWAFGSGRGGVDDAWRLEVRSEIRAARDGRGPAEILGARQQAVNPTVEPEPTVSQPEPAEPGPSWLRRSWVVIQENRLISAILAAVIGGLILAVILHWTGLSNDGPKSSTSTTSATAAPERREQAANGGAVTYADPGSLSGAGQRIEPNHYVQVSCKLYSPSPPSVRPDGYWYKIESEPWSGHYYAPANSFWNGGSPEGQVINTDRDVPDC